CRTGRCPSRAHPQEKAAEPPPLVCRMLIDTHCHVHVLREPPAGKAAAGCCGPCQANATSTNNSSSSGGSNNDSSSSSSRLSHAEASVAVAAAARRGGLRQDSLVSSNDERAPGGQEQKTSLQALPINRVVHITMGICEEDWSRAISHGRIDNFSAGAVCSPIPGANIPHHEQLLLPPPSATLSAALGGEGVKDD
ncbi:unnamed protein product, partial [Laminaria digitata]